MKKYLRVWWIFTINSFQTQLLVRWGVILFIVGKLLRFFIFIFFIYILIGKTNSLLNYSLDQVILFYLTFSLVDTLVQTVFREVYRFRYVVVSGSFDFYLIKPINPLFRSLVTGPDIIDLFLLIPLIGAIAIYIQRLDLFTIIGLILYILLILIAFLLALSFHILVLSLAILTTEIDHAVLVYRDTTGMGRFPIDIYKEPIRGLLTFVVPVGIMMSFPVKALLGLISWELLIYSLILAVILLYISIKIWHYSLRQYSSASS